MVTFWGEGKGQAIFPLPLHPHPPMGLTLEEHKLFHLTRPDQCQVPIIGIDLPSPAWSIAILRDPGVGPALSFAVMVGIPK